jgi:hypothetical protein
MDSILNQNHHASTRPDESYNRFFPSTRHCFEDFSSADFSKGPVENF